MAQAKVQFYINPASLPVDLNYFTPIVKTVLKHMLSMNLKMHSYISATACFMFAAYLQMCVFVC